ncbi:TPA: hypothetical protein PCL15_000781 [Klebsiella pneumoniae]|uniref:hypothetical protein n=1 Tax=Klebsiella quasipneumoniae TaxID=1463165 RepID=UPI0014383085|nr:hypothetical protein [Klebsiella quasipneumoniae]NKF18529.1 hypothetical protein [Klebsiella quasipneumoniae]QPV84645.1 hypothetical protein I8N77_07595 [Klebsiella quasipneumoniae]HBQ2920716.1 hypothetical protein [Klebsiella quasipneumoniae subsp. similipneumoniae]HDG7987204.1 hypothetical protein [Klebsiella pneumoniae]
MNISTVNELIASLETAGELSIREQKFLKLAKAFKQLASENVALKNAITDHSHSVHFCEVCGKDDPCSTDDVCYALKDIPATDAYLAGIKADAITATLDACSDYLETDCVMDRLDISYEEAEKRTSGAMEFHNSIVAFAQQLREGAK